MENSFDRFWQAWPKSTRKGAKSQCLKVWNKTYCESCADQIIKHVEWMKTTDQWRSNNGAFIPAPLVYLNQQRWDGAEIPETSTMVQERDPYLVKLDQEKNNAVPMPDWIKEKMKGMRNGN
jgi:hypothetical protein